MIAKPDYQTGQHALLHNHMINTKRRHYIMHMTFRWYGEGNDTVTLEQIRQIPGVEGIVWALHNKQPGEIWEPDEIREVTDHINE